MNPASPNGPELIQKGMDQMTQFAGSARRLGEAIVSPQLSHPDMQLVKHPDSAAFTLVAIPDSMAQYADCSGIKRGEELRDIRARNPQHRAMASTMLQDSA